MERDFKGIWIPADIWLDERLTPLDKIILVEIDSLDIGGEGCYASNAYLADFCKCSETKISKSISLLAKLGYVEVVSFTGRSRKLQSCLAKSARQTCTKDKEPCKKCKSLTLYNNIDINIEEGEKSPPTLENIKTFCERNHVETDPERFYLHYTASGWKVNGKPVENWKALLIKWALTEYADKKQNAGTGERFKSFDLAEVEKLFEDDILNVAGAVKDG